MIYFKYVIICIKFLYYKIKFDSISNVLLIRLDFDKWKEKKIKKVALVTCTNRGMWFEIINRTCKIRWLLTVSLIAIDSTKDKEAVRELLTDNGASYSFLSILDYYKRLN